MDINDSAPVRKPLFHYTTQKGLLGIIRDEAIWATDILYLNDAKEYRYTFDLIQEEIEVLEKSAPKNDLPLLERIDAMADSVLRTGNFPFFRTFVCSFSKNPDQLSQWRGYGNGDGGFSISFNFTKIKPLLAQQGLKIKKCSYKRDDQKQEIQKTVHNILSQFRKKQNDPSFWTFGNPWSSQLFSIAFLPLASIFKHPKFFEEWEWRLVSSRIDYSDQSICYREGRSMIIPYISIKLTDSENLLPLSKIIIGPTPNPDLSTSSIMSLLHSKNIHCKIENSEIPYRPYV